MGTKLCAVLSLVLLLGACATSPAPRVITGQQTELSAELHDAARTGNIGEVQRLIDAGADINARSSTDRRGFSPLHTAVASHQSKLVTVLIDNGAEIDVQDNEGDTPLHVASGIGSASMTELLVRKGANVEAKTKVGRTPLFTAISAGLPQSIKRLLQGYGVDAGAVQKSGRGESFEVVQILIAGGANVNARDKWGGTPLIEASLIGDLPIVELLIEHGADIDATTSEGRSALYFAEQLNNEDVIDVLRKHSMETQ